MPKKKQIKKRTKKSDPNVIEPGDFVILNILRIFRGESPIDYVYFMVLKVGDEDLIVTDKSTRAFAVHRRYCQKIIR